MNWKKKIFFLLLLPIGCNYLFSQNTIDSLQLIFRNAKTDSVKLKALNDLSFELYRLAATTGGDYGAAMKLANESLLFAQKIHNKKGEGRALNVMGFILKEEGDFPESLKKVFAILKISEEIGDTACAATQYLSMGEIYFLEGNFKEALKAHFASLKLNQEIGSINEYSYNYNHIGKDYYRIGNNDSAMKYYSLGLEIGEKLQDTRQVGVSYNGLGNVYKNLKEFRSALKYDFAALKIFNLENALSHKADCCISIGDVYLRQAEFIDERSAKKIYSNGLSYFDKGLQLAKQVKDKYTIMDAYSGLIEAYKGINNYKSALNYSTLFSQLKDSIYNNNSFSKATELKIQYESEKLAEQEKAKKEKARIDNENKNKLLLLGSAALVVIAFFAALLFRQRNIKKRAIEKAETSHKMAELEMQSLRSQLNPHFMFNSLNSIQTLILKEDADRSQSYLSRFARLLRMLLENADAPFIPLWKEIDFLQLYLSLESLRVPDLQYSISTDPALNAEQTLIPNMFLQPYLENAIWHGLSYKDTDKRLQIRISRENGTINYEIEDNGVGRKKAEELKSLFRKQHQSKGMELLSRRIKLLNNEYNSTIQTDVTDVIKNNEVAGTLVSIKIPVAISEPTQN